MGGGGEDGNAVFLYEILKTKHKISIKKRKENNSLQTAVVSDTVNSSTRRLRQEELLQV